MTRVFAGMLAIAIGGCGSREPTVGVLTADPSELTVSADAGGDVARQRVGLRLINIGGAALTIQRVETPCCQKDLSVEYPFPQRTLKPGESTELLLSALPPVVGRRDRIVYVHTDTSSASAIPITIKLIGGELQPPYVMGVKPIDMEFSGSKPGAIVNRELKLCAIEHQGVGQWIEGLTSNNQMVSAEQVGPPDEKRLDEGIVMRCYTFRVAATVPDSVDAPVASAIEIKVASPSRMPVNGFLAFVRLAEAVRVVPTQVSIPNASVSAFPFDRKILLIPTDGNHKHFSPCAELPEWLKVDEDSDGAELPRGAQRFVLRVRRPASDDVAETSIKFQSSESLAAPVMVPIRISIVCE